MTAPTVNWPSGWTSDESCEVAAATFALLFNTRRWVHRRTELISFIDENSTRRIISVDFTLPSLPGDLLGIPRGNEKVAFVPLTLLRKRVLRDFSLRDEDGTSLPLLTRTQNSDISRAMLIGTAKAVLDGEALMSDILDDLVAIPGPIQQAEEAFARLCKDDDTVSSNAQRAKLMSEPRLRSLAEDFVHSFLFLVPIPAIAGRRRIIKFSYEEEPGQRVRPQTGRLRWLSQTFGVEPVPYLIPVSSMGDSASFHAEVSVPEELEIARTRTIDLKRNEVLSDRIETVGAQRVHLYTPNEHRTVWSLMEVSVLVARKGLLMASFVVSLLTSAMLTFSFINLSAVAQSTDAASALLLAIPVIFSGYLLRPDEHPLVTKLFSGLRVLVLTSGLCALLASVLLIVGVHGNLLTYLWEGVLVASWLITMALAFVAWWPRRGSRTAAPITATGGGSPHGVPPADVTTAVRQSTLDLQGYPVESAEGWRSGFTGIDSEDGIAKTLEIAAKLRS